MSESAYERVRAYVDNPYTHDNIAVVHSELVNISSGDLRALVDEWRAMNEALGDIATATDISWAASRAIVGMPSPTPPTSTATDRRED